MMWMLSASSARRCSCDETDAGEPVPGRARSGVVAEVTVTRVLEDLPLAAGQKKQKPGRSSRASSVCTAVVGGIYKCSGKTDSAGPFEVLVQQQAQVLAPTNIRSPVCAEMGRAS